MYHISSLVYLIQSHQNKGTLHPTPRLSTKNLPPFLSEDPSLGQPIHNCGPWVRLDRMAAESRVKSISIYHNFKHVLEIIFEFSGVSEMIG